MQEQYIPNRLTAAAQAVPYQPENSYITHADIKRFLKRYASVLKASTAIGILLGAVYSFTAVPLYTAHSQIIIDPSIPQAMTEKQATVFGIDNAQVESQIEVLKSESIAQAVVSKLKLAENPLFGSPSTSLLSYPIRWLYGTPELTAADRERIAIARFKSGLDVRRVGLSYSIDVYYSAAKPELAAKIANATAEAYIADQIEARGNAARQGGQWLEARIDHLRKQMNGAALQAQEFRAKRDYRISPLRQGAAGAPPSAPVNPVPTDAATHQNTMEELDSTAQTYRRIYESYLLAYTESVQKQSYPVSNARVITAATTPDTKSYPRTNLILLFGGVMGALAGIGIAFARSQLDLSVVNARQTRDELGIECLAMVPSLVDHKRPSSLVRLSTGLALVQRPADLLALAGRAARSIGRRIRRLFVSSPDEEKQLAIADRSDFIAVVTMPFSAFTHAMKRLRTTLSLAARGQPLRSIAITSTLPSEGKSTIAANLASLYAAAGVRTLLVDGDLRRASLSRAFAPEAEHGLQDIIDAEQPLQDCVIRVEDGGFDILPIRTADVDGFTETSLSEEQAAPLIDEMLKSYDFVIVEIPPLGASLDGLAVASLTDGAVIVSEWSRTPLPMLSESVRLLRNAGARIAGFVINKVDASEPGDADLAGHYFR